MERATLEEHANSRHLHDDNATCEQPFETAGLVRDRPPLLEESAVVSKMINGINTRREVRACSVVHVQRVRRFCEALSDACSELSVPFPVGSV